MNLLLIVIIGVGSGRYIIIYNQILEPFTQTVPDPRSARQEQFGAQGESLGRLPPPRVLLLKCSVNLSMQSARYFTNFTFRLSKNNKQHLECLIVNLQVNFQKTVSLASSNNLSESLTNLVWLPKMIIYMFIYACKAQVWVRNQLLIMLMYRLR